MALQFTRSELKAAVNANIHGKIGMLIDEDETMNRAVRQCYANIDFRTARRKQALTPGLFNGVFDYPCPTDLKANALIDIPAQAKRQDGEFFLIPSEQFDISNPKGGVAIDDYDLSRIMKVNSSVNDYSLVASELDSLTSASSDGSSWVLFGDATSLAADTDDYVKGNGSIKWNISAAGGTTAGIQHSSIYPLDMTDYFGGTSAFFVWAKINSATNLTNYILRFGTDSSNYYSKTVTTQHDGTAFKSGWNLLRFDVSSYSTTGTPTNTNIEYFVIYMTKTAGKVSESDYKFDWLVLKRGVKHDIKYYTKYGWNNSSGTYIENSLADTDLLVADQDEYEIIIEKASEIAAGEVREYEIAAKHKADYKEMALEYQKKNPSEAAIMTSEYYTYG